MKAFCRVFTPVLIGVALGGLLPGQAIAEEPKSGPIVMVAKSFHGCFSAMVRGVGYFFAATDAVVMLDAEGFRVSEVLVGEGDRVKEGQILARLVRPPSDMPAPPGAPVDPRTSINVKAPAAGLVVRSNARIGTAAPPPGSTRRDPLFMIAIDGKIELEAEVPSIHVPKLAFGQSARILLPDDTELTGRVRRVPGEINPATQLGKVRIAVEEDPAIRVGMFAHATIDTGRSCGVSIPRSAVLFKAAGTSVQIVRNRVIETRRVRVGLMSETHVEIREGLSESDTVVANAGTSLRDGEYVNPVYVERSN